MMILHSLMEIIGAVALLMLGTHLIRTGMLRTFGEGLRRWVGRRLKSRPSAFLAGMGLSTLLQSSTASALLVASLQKKGLVTTAMALSAVLGADLGSAVMVRVLSFDIKSLSPLLIIIGVFLYRRKERTAYGQMGLIFLGLAFIMMALNMILTATAPFKTSELLMQILSVVDDWVILSLLLGAVLACLCFSSLAVVMITASLVLAGLVSVHTGLWMVLGANLGSACLALMTTSSGSPVARRAPLGNALFRSSACVVGSVALATCPYITVIFSNLPEGVIYFHVLFNALAGMVGLFFVKPVARWVDKVLPEKQKEENGDIEFLTEESMISSATGLQAARQEIIKTVRLTKYFWCDLMPLIKTNPTYGQILELKGRGEVLNYRCGAVARYLTRLMLDQFSLKDAQNWQTLRHANSNLSFAINVIEQAYTVLETRKCAKNRYFSEEGMRELVQIQLRIKKNFEVLETYLESEDPVKVQQAKHFLTIEKNATAINDFLMVESHVVRLNKGQSESLETSNVHMEVLTLFHRANQLICGIGKFEAPDEGQLGGYFPGRVRGNNTPVTISKVP